MSLVDAPSERLSCVSYSPYRKPGQTPFDPQAVVPPAQIEEDMRLLSKRFDCVRTYAVSRGLGEVPRIAAKYGMQVLLGIWIGRDPRENEGEIVQGIALANRHADTVRGVIVGNEVLLRREQPVDALRAMIERVRGAVRVPVTYADVWEFWLKNAELAGVTSFVTIHILPYWEDHPVPVEEAVAHVKQIYRHVGERFPGRRILIGETGWPSVGRNRQGAIPTRVNQARFIREFALAANETDFPYNVVEAFDQPWKRAQEGAVGGYWGLYDVDGQEKFPFRGAVVEEPRWKWGLAAAAALALTFLLAGLLQRDRPGVTGACVWLLGGTASGGILAAQVRTLWLTSRNDAEWLVGGGMTLLALVAAWTTTGLLAAQADGKAPPPPPAIAAALRRVLGQGDGAGAGGVVAGVLRFTFLFAAAIVCLLLLFDARYRDFPLELFVAPVGGFCLLALYDSGQTPTAPDDNLEERLLAWLLTLAAPAIAVSERVTNLHAVAWSALCLAFAATILLPRWRGLVAGEHQGAEQKAHG